ncbi:hypothetical protein ISS40_10055 [Candidatus Bathyarchaeota archaeon]|nr:hypothetical protein [Candidatus Bathyarchaeota archaeon]MBL7169008.1 hypothetical protein [Candidatus Bathyarchaeota archaeon]
MSKMFRYGNVAAAFTIVLALLVFSWLSVGADFPVFEFTSDTLNRQLVPVEPYDDIASLASRFLWDNRALDLTGQAFVIVASVICCLALLKLGEGSH